MGFFSIHELQGSGQDAGLMIGGQILFPLAAAFMYALATIILKRALEEGTGPWRVTFVCNMVMALGYQVCWVMRTRGFDGTAAMHAALAGCTFFAGQVFTFIALKRGDVSVVTPILGSKVVWVAMFVELLAGQRLPAQMWAAAVTTAAGTAILGYQPGAHPRRVALSVGAALATACSFAVTDVQVMTYAPGWGFGSFVPVMFLTVGLLSLGFLPLLETGGWSPLWLGTGSVILAVQALGMAYAIATYGEVTTVNVVYNSRGLWSVMLVWLAGGLFGNKEGEGKRMTLRILGAGLLLGGILIVGR